MTIASTNTKTIYAGNGSTTGFAIPFMFLRDDDIEVVLSKKGKECIQTISTHYQVSGAGAPNGGVLTMNSAPATGETLVIRRNPTLVQEVDYVENDAFPAATHEAALDKLTMICQALSERLDRTITFRVSSAVTGVEVPDPEAGRILTWNDSGDNLVNKGAGEMGTILLPLSVSEGGTGAENADAAMTNLGFGATGKATAKAKNTSEAATALGLSKALKSDTNAKLRAVYGEEAQVQSGGYLPNVITRNHILWTPGTQNAWISNNVQFPYDGTYIIHLYPGGVVNSVHVGSAYKRVSGDSEPDPDAGEIRIAVEVFNGRKTIVSITNVEV